MRHKSAILIVATLTIVLGSTRTVSLTDGQEGTELPKQVDMASPGNQFSTRPSLEGAETHPGKKYTELDSESSGAPKLAPGTGASPAYFSQPNLAPGTGSMIPRSNRRRRFLRKLWNFAKKSYKRVKGYASRKFGEGEDRSSESQYQSDKQCE